MPPINAPCQKWPSVPHRVAASTRITSLDWWGTYTDLCGDPCVAADGFVVTFYVNESGPARRVVASYDLAGAVARTPTGQTIPLEVGAEEYQYSADLTPPLTVEGGKRYWVEIRNAAAPDCIWWWETAPAGSDAA